MSDKKVVTRFAPSPTGFMHVGGVRTALYAYLYAKKMNGKFILRIEDTDKEREVVGASELIKQALRYILQDPEKLKAFPTEDDLKLDQHNPWDDFYTQSERLALYIEWAKKLTENGFAYFDPHSKEELDLLRQKAQDEKRAFLYREHRPEVLDSQWDIQKLANNPLRFRVEKIEKKEWFDAVRGKLSAGPEALDDFIILKTDGYPTYNFCHIVDDIEMEVSHVMRGEEFVSSTPKFLALYEALQKIYPEKNITIPTFVTLPPILGETGTKKLSKRDGAKDILDYHKEGFLPEAVANFLAFQGWNPGGERELYNTKELIESFSLERIQKSGARWNPAKLDWFNKEYMKNLSADDTLVLKKVFLSQLPISLQKKYLSESVESISFCTLFEKYLERISYLAELASEPILSELFMIESDPNIDLELIYADLDKEITKDILSQLLDLFDSLDESNWQAAFLKDSLTPLITAHGAKNVLWPLRTSLSGQKKSLDPFSLLAILGKGVSMRRVHNSLEKMNA